MTLTLIRSRIVDAIWSAWHGLQAPPSTSTHPCWTPRPADRSPTVADLDQALALLYAACARPIAAHQPEPSTRETSAVRG